MKVFFNKYQNCKDAGSFSPSAGKPVLAVADWQKHGLITNEDIVDFKPVTEKELCLAHDPAFVSGILNLSIENGFNNRNEGVAFSLPYTTGSLLAAARYAVERNTFTCSPTSGFHHAGYDFAGGFCTFNGLAVTAAVLHKENNGIKVGILDCDAHFGNGTADIIKRKKMRYVEHFTQGNEFHDKHDVGRDGINFFNWLRNALFDLRGCDVILYQAGADPHIRDPLGGLLTTPQMQLRDEIVFEELSGKAVAWNLAGGYQVGPDGSIDAVIELHRNTAIECIKHLHK